MRNGITFNRKHFRAFLLGFTSVQGVNFCNKNAPMGLNRLNSAF